MDDQLDKLRELCQAHVGHSRLEIYFSVVIRSMDISWQIELLTCSKLLELIF